MAREKSRCRKSAICIRRALVDRPTLPLIDAHLHRWNSVHFSETTNSRRQIKLARKRIFMLRGCIQRVANERTFSTPFADQYHSTAVAFAERRACLFSWTSDVIANTSARSIGGRCARTVRIHGPKKASRAEALLPRRTWMKRNFCFRARRLRLCAGLSSQDLDRVADGAGDCLALRPHAYSTLADLV